MQRAKKKRSLAEKINVMRASVMGANDGILSVAGIVIGGCRGIQQQRRHFFGWDCRNAGRNNFDGYG